MKVRFGLDIDIDMENVEVEGSSVADCKSKLLQMTIQEMLEASGYVKNSNMTDIDFVIAETTGRVECRNIEYDIDDDEMDFNKVRQLPKELTLDVELTRDGDTEEAVKDAIALHNDHLGYYPVKYLDYMITELK